MILLLSKEQEETTNSVIDWLDFYNASYYRFNGTQLNKNAPLFLDISKPENNKNLPFNANDIKVVWYRRWESNNKKTSKKIDLEASLKFRFNQYLNSELRGLPYAFFSLFNSAYWLSKPEKHVNEDKFYYLKIAQSLAIDIPQTYILNTKKDLVKILSSGIKLITKNMSNAMFMKIANKTYTQYTEKIDFNDLANIPETFFPSMFQEKIDKEYEIRTFYLDNQFYSMAIFSQLDNQTAIDFRKYNFKKPNRRVPYRLPKDLRQKLKKMIKILSITTCSIDIIKSTNGKYYFLEINLVGQFGMVSLPCNYYLEKKVAEHLIKHNQ